MPRPYHAVVNEQRTDQRRPVRWRTLWCILGLIAAAMAFVWYGLDLFGGASSVQQRVMTSYTIATVGVVSLAVWLLLLSRLAAWTRVRVVLVVGLLIGAFSACFRYAGVDGDLVAVFEPRWKTVERVSTGTALSGIAGDFVQFGGPAREGIVPSAGLALDWDSRPPVLVWRRPVGAAWSGFAVSGDLAITQEQHGEEERVVCYRLATGDVVWSHGDDTLYASNLAGDGPRATPTIHDGRVYTMGGTGRVNALDLETGALIWTRDVVTESGGEVLPWGMSASPLVADGKVYVTSGGNAGNAMFACDAVTGAVVWKSGDDAGGYASPTMLKLVGTGQLVMFNVASVSGFDPADGKVLWSHPWSGRQPNVAQPLPVGTDRLFVSSGYGVGGELLQLTSESSGGAEASLKVSSLWSTVRLKSKFASMILDDGHIFGLDDGILTCVDAESGKRRWKRGRYGHGQLLRVGDTLLVMAESGEVVLVALDPEQHRELARIPVIDGKVWNPPALAGSRLLVRNDIEAALFLLPTN